MSKEDLDELQILKPSTFIDVAKPSYYSIIPASVRYSGINSSAKLLYGEITALCNTRGYCFASNEYFAKLYGVHKATIKDWITILVNNKFLHRELLYKENSKQVKERRLWLLEALPLGVERPADVGAKTPPPKGKNTSDNNTVNSVFITEVINRDHPNNTDFITLVIDWIEYKKSEKKQSYKTEKSLKTFINRLIKLSDGNFEKAKDLIETSIANNWSGLFASNSKKYPSQAKNEHRNSEGFKSGSQLYGGL